MIPAISRSPAGCGDAVERDATFADSVIMKVMILTWLYQYPLTPHFELIAELMLQNNLCEFSITKLASVGCRY